MTEHRTLGAPVSGGRALVTAGAAAAAAAVLLYVTALSRAVGVVTGVVALVAVALGAVAVRTQRWPPRPVLYVLAAALVALVVYGIGLSVYALSTESRTASPL
jgi:hypothetical protein